MANAVFFVPSRYSTNVCFVSFFLQNEVTCHSVSYCSMPVRSLLNKRVWGIYSFLTCNTLPWVSRSLSVYAVTLFETTSSSCNKQIHPCFHTQPHCCVAFLIFNNTSVAWEPSTRLCQTNAITQQCVILFVHEKCVVKLNWIKESVVCFFRSQFSDELCL